MNKDRSSENTKTASAAAVMPDFNSIPTEIWDATEAQIRRVLNCVRPTIDSEDKRRDLTEYISQVINLYTTGYEVLQYGSVPLKTYLPDGDIDLTAVSSDDLLCRSPRQVMDVLVDHLKGNNKFNLKDIRFVDAEVKIVKMVVNDITVDVSFNQLSGLCALCFFEKVDHLVGKDHIFKLSIVLIKSWCYYESRIAGSTYGLLSTYALETLVLYIFRMHYASLTCPLKVLYRFLEYYSQFDWENYCISIDGPIKISSLPYNIVVVNPLNHPLFGGTCLSNYISMFTVPCKEAVGDIPPFIPKHLNIIDPLKANNNLGRSINEGNFHRIKFALRYAADKLGKIMESPRENIEAEIKKFFGNIVKMNQSKIILNPRTTFDTLSTTPISEVYYEDDSDLESLNGDHDNIVIINGSLAGNDKFALSLVNGDVNDGFSNGNGDATCIHDESDGLKLADLSGDYIGNVRNLMHAQRNQGSINCTLRVYNWDNLKMMGWSPQSSSHVSVNFPASNYTDSGAGPYVSPMGSPTRENGWVPDPHAPFYNHYPNQTHGGIYEAGSSSSVNSNGPDPQSPQGNYGQCSAPTQVDTQRRLMFGSFGTVSMNDSEYQKKTYSLCVRTASVSNKSLPLMDETEFPPLSVLSNEVCMQLE